MDLERLRKILDETTMSFRKGDVVTTKDSNGVRVTEIYDMPKAGDVREVKGDSLEFVDVHFINIGVLKKKAEGFREEFIEVIKTYPDQGRFKKGLSYIEIGAEVDSQDYALRLLALGKVLGLWDVVTPKKMGITDEAQANQLAGMGMVMFTGFEDEQTTDKVQQEEK